MNTLILLPWLLTLTAIALYYFSRKGKEVLKTQIGNYDTKLDRQMGKIVHLTAENKSLQSDLEQLKRIFKEAAEYTIEYTEDYSNILNGATITGDIISINVLELLDKKYIKIISVLYEANTFPKDFQNDWAFDPERMTVSFSMLNRDEKNILDSKSWVEFLEERKDFIKTITSYIDNEIKEMENAIQSTRRLEVINIALTPEIQVREKRAYTKKSIG